METLLFGVFPYSGSSRYPPTLYPIWQLLIFGPPWSLPKLATVAVTIDLVALLGHVTVTGALPPYRAVQYFVQHPQFQLPATSNVEVRVSLQRHWGIGVENTYKWMSSVARSTRRACTRPSDGTAVVKNGRRKKRPSLSTGRAHPSVKLISKVARRTGPVRRRVTAVFVSWGSTKLLPELKFILADGWKLCSAYRRWLTLSLVDPSTRRRTGNGCPVDRASTLVGEPPDPNCNPKDSFPKKEGLLRQISPVAGDFDDPLGWWKQNQGTLPSVAVVVRDILAIPGDLDDPRDSSMCITAKERLNRGSGTGSIMLN
ncbi:hypothetical protein B0H17DRAFT_1126655 [Mycena rosella]|uniref:HAT C-terminal dimerisation domain-containing protein n=1 Tax=Mycena rosella TaxID=1033263 RepID=A0AAD7M7W3_MYCRO|nr:hypothetical protein B0H17DRAFT_1126655 [Mycena rosella]